MTGEEVIGTLVEITDTHVTFDQLLFVQLVQTHSDVGMRLAPFMVSANEKTKTVLSRAALMTGLLSVREEIKSEYNRVTGKLIQPPKSSFILPG